MTEVSTEEFVCEDCGREFGSKLALGVHWGRTHRKDYENGEEGGNSKPPFDEGKLFDLLFPEEGFAMDAATVRRVAALLDEARAIYEGR